jgi:lysozyme family protein
MANSNLSIAKVVKEEGGYQSGSADAGNYFKGKLLGTKFGITPNAYFSYYKKEPVQDTIKNLTVDQAVPIYKKNYWDKIRGDEIKNDSVADLLLFVIVNSGTGMIKSLKHIMNETAGKKIVAETTTPFTTEEIKLLNALPQDIYFNKVKAWREGFYKALVQKKPSNQVYLKGWLNRLNQHVYSGAVSKSGTTTLLLVGLLLFGAGAFAGYKYS